MKRRQFLAAGAIGVGAIPVAPAIAQSTPELRWRLACAFPKTMDILAGAPDTLARYVSDATDGRFQIQVANQDGGPSQAFEQVSSGAVEMAHTALAYQAETDPTFGLLTSAPFGLNTRQQNAWYYQNGGLDLANAFLGRVKCYALPGGNTGGQMGGWFKREVTSVADLAGLRMRVSGLAGSVMQRLGAVPTRLAGAEVPQALERGNLDAAEWIGPYDDEKLGAVRFAPFYYYPGWQRGGASLHFLIGRERWDGLPKSYKAVLEAASAYANTEVTAKYDARSPAALRRLVGSGAQLRPFSQEILEAARKAANDLYDETSAKNAEFKKIWDSMRTFRNEEYLWFQVAEYTYDNFMIRARARGG